MADDSPSFDAFYAASRQRLLGQLTLMCGDRDQSQDALQEAYVRAWERWSRVARLDDPEGWVRTVAWRLSVSRWRRRRVARAAQPVLAAGLPSFDETTAPEVLDVRAALARLPLDQRRALVLHELCDLSVAQVARETGAPVGTVKARLARGRAALAALLEPVGDGVDPAGPEEVPDVRPA